MLPEEVSWFAVTWAFIAQGKHQYSRTSYQTPSPAIYPPDYREATLRTARKT